MCRLDPWLSSLMADVSGAMCPSVQRLPTAEGEGEERSQAASTHRIIKTLGPSAISYSFRERFHR